MKKGWLAVLLMCAAILVCGCSGGGGERRYFSYLEGEVCLSVTGMLDGMDFSALVQSEAAEQGAIGARGFTLTYLSPEALAGVSVCVRGGEPPSVRRGELTSQGEAYEPLAWVGELLLKESAVNSTGREQAVGADGTPVQAVVLRTADGATRWHDAKTGDPIRLRCQADGRSVEMEITGDRAQATPP